MAIEIRDDAKYTAAMPSGSWLVGGRSTTDAAPTAFSRESLLQYVQANLTSSGWPLQQKGGAFSGHVSIVSESRTLTGWPVGIAYQASEDRVWIFQMEMPTHGLSTSGTQLGSRLVAYYTDDNGNSREGLRTIYSDSDKRIIEGAIGNMASGRIGGIITCSADATTTTDRTQFFIYSDDNCATWTWVELTGLTIEHFVYGMLMPLPTAYGGDDTTGFCVTTYAGTNSAKIIKTTDNGTTWTDATLKAGDATLASVNEPSLVFASAGAIMFARGGTNLFAAKSTDLTTWSAWTDTGIALGSNPVHAVVDADDFVHIAICDREDFTGSVDDNVMRTYRIAGAALYADLTALSSVDPVREWQFPNRGLGYIHSMLVGDEWYHLIKVRESIGSQVSYAQSGAFGLITTSPRPTPSVVALQMPPRQIVHNPDFAIWNNGTSFLDQTAAVETADRWFYSPSGATADITRVTLTEAEKVMFPHRPLYGLKIDTIDAGNVHSDFAGIIQYHYGAQFYDLLRLLQARSEIDVVVYGLGTPIPSGRIGINIDYGTGGSADTSVSGTLTTAYTANGGSYVQTARMRIPLIGNPTIGTAPRVWIALDCSSSLTAYAATIVGVFCYVGVAPFEPAAPSAIESALQCALADDGTDTAGTISFHRPVAVEGSPVVTEADLAAAPTLTQATANTTSASVHALALRNTNDTTPVNILKLEGDRATPTAGSDRLYVNWWLSNASGTQVEYARTEVRASDTTAASEDGQFRWHLQNAGTITDAMTMTATNLGPTTNDGMALGNTARMWADLYLASGGVINWNNGNATLTHSAGKITSNVPVTLPNYTVATLPSAATMGFGAIAFVSDANATTIRSTVAGGGVNKVMVFSDGTNWLIAA